jgi:hypothetical protein
LLTNVHNFRADKNVAKANAKALDIESAGPVGGRFLRVLHVLRHIFHALNG